MSFCSGGKGHILAVMVCALAVSNAPAQVLPQASTRAECSKQLLFKSGTVDLTHNPSILSASAVFAADMRYVIHLAGPMTPERRMALDAAGARLFEYIPVDAFVADLSQADPAALADLGFVDWVGEFRTEWKTGPADGEQAFLSAERQALQQRGRTLLAVEFFADADPSKSAGFIQSTGAKVRSRSQEGRAARFVVEAKKEQLARLRSLKDVAFVEEALEAEPRNASNSWIMQSNVSNARPLWDAGLHGENEIVGVIDWDMHETHCAFSDPGGNPIGPSHRKILAYYGLGINPNSGLHGTHVAGNVVADELAGTQADLKGMAYEARIVFHHYNGVLSGGLLLVNDRLTISHNDGARIHSNSWGSGSTSYGAWPRDIDLFTSNNEEDLVLVAVANFGAVTTPENSKNCLAVAGTSDSPNQGNYCKGSSGPTTDGRQKPEVYGVSCGSRSALDNSACGLNDTGGSGGTSYSTPAVAGLAMLARQYFVEGFYPTGMANPAHTWTPAGALLKALVINSAVDMSGLAGYYTGSEGWGRVLMDDAIHLAGDARKLLVEDVRNTNGLSTADVRTHYIVVGEESMPLKITLVWTDQPAALNAAFTPVNDLDLVVTSPAADVYLGNVFSGVQSTTGGAADFRNNTEQVHRTAPAPGLWRVDVDAAAVNVGTQGYALAITGDVDCLKGDANGDGLLDGLDVGPFVEILLSGGTFFERCTSDMNSSGEANEFDVDEFVAALLE